MTTAGGALPRRETLDRRRTRRLPFAPLAARVLRGVLERVGSCAPLLALTSLLVLACRDQTLSTAPPFDQFYFPAGLALRHVPSGCVGGSAGCQTQLFVVSTNFDLRYDTALGGTLISVDVGQALAAAVAPGAPSPVPIVPLGAVRIGSFGGEVTLVDDATCAGWSGAQALVTSRSLKTLYRVDVDDQGALSCGAQCAVPLDQTLGDPYGITVACGNFSGAARSLAFVTYLRAPNGEGWLTQLDLQAADAAGLPTSPTSQIDVGLAPTGQAAFDAARARLYVTSRYVNPVYEPLRWLDLGSPGLAASAINLASTVPGADLRGIALSSDGTRAYVALRIYDTVAATTLGGRPTTDLAGALAVVDISEQASGGPVANVLRLVPLDRGATEVRVIPRQPAVAGGQAPRDLVAVTSADDSTLTLYDDETGTIANTYALCGSVPGTGDPSAPPPCDPGNPLLGVQPFGLAVEPMAAGAVRLYVGSFDRGWVNVIQLDGAHPDVPPVSWVRVGPERQ